MFVFMFRYWLWLSVAFFMSGLCTGFNQSNNVSLAQKPWFEARTAHFNVFSCNTPQDMNKLAVRLEQFCEAYSFLAGASAAASPPTVVMAFPDEQSMRPFLPLYQGKPGNLSGFFNRNSDENLIVLAMPHADSNSPGMEVIFHEYAHLLFRRNDRIWPVWLKEGMAEIYSTFETTGRQAQIARPIDRHLQVLAHEPLMPLHELFTVTHDSPQYNESTRQGMFYAESWLLTHFLMAGDNPAYKARFGRFTELLMAGQMPEQAFTNALGTTLPVMETELRRYLERGVFKPVELPLPADVSSPIYVASRAITPVETYFLLGDELLRIDRLDAAESYFTQAKKIAPASAFPYEGLGLLAAQRGQHDEALRELAAALQRGSASFLVHYIYAREKYRQTADPQGRYAPLKEEAAAEIRDELQKSLALMPNFGPAHEQLGFFEMVQGENLAAAEQQLQLAIQLEPENPSYLLTLAQAQLRGQNVTAARRTLEPLLLPNVDAKLRVPAEAIIQKINQSR
jgi:tetratricopeptide (TPR) repeat protein